MVESRRSPPNWIPMGHFSFFPVQDRAFSEKTITCQRVMDGSFIKFTGFWGRQGCLCRLDSLPTILIVSSPTNLKPILIFFCFSPLLPFKPKLLHPEDSPARRPSTARERLCSFYKERPAISKNYLIKFFSYIYSWNWGGDKIERRGRTFFFDIKVGISWVLSGLQIFQGRSREAPDGRPWVSGSYLASITPFRMTASPFPLKTSSRKRAGPACHTLTCSFSPGITGLLNRAE